MKRARVHNLIIVDASASMTSIYAQALAGINETINTIHKMSEESPLVEQYLSLLSFAGGGEKLQYVYKHTEIEKVSTVISKDYPLRGMTALYDAIGESVKSLRKRTKKDDKVLVTIITDGQENNSRLWSEGMVQQLIDELRTEGWVFTYIGANQDVELEAKKMGVRNSMQFEATIEGTEEMFEREGRCRRNWNERLWRGEENLEEGYFMEEKRNCIPSERIAPERISHLAPNEIFVFGSNREGCHNGGAAKAALLRFGARFGQGEGIQGQSYAIPSTGHPQVMIEAIERFMEYARQHQHLRFLVTAIGCGSAGYHPRDIATLFRDAANIPNIYLPAIFWRYLA